ncbi:hypothetical protein BDW75DRAFT_225884 [Aspergillus navahoensis]
MPFPPDPLHNSAHPLDAKGSVGQFSSQHGRRLHQWRIFKILTLRHHRPRCRDCRLSLSVPLIAQLGDDEEHSVGIQATNRDGGAHKTITISHCLFFPRRSVCRMVHSESYLSTGSVSTHLKMNDEHVTWIVRRPSQPLLPRNWISWAKTIYIPWFRHTLGRRETTATITQIKFRTL